MPRFAIRFKPHYSYLLHDRVPLSPTTLPGNIDKLPWLLVGSPLFVRLLDLYVGTGCQKENPERSDLIQFAPHHFPDQAPFVPYSVAHNPNGEGECRDQKKTLIILHLSKPR